ncbi:MAG: ABC transporter permease [Pelagimonas sp.]|uniref:ABC transporter permease n=1 Tax=Pelagimonas sp. TaxID=2073170 RepID=UPI003D6A339D
MTRASLARFGLSVAFLVLLILAWKYLSDNRIVSPIYLPGPDRTWNALMSELRGGDLVWRIVKTLEHMAFGWLLASFIGVVIGVAISIFPFIRRLLGPTLEFFRPLPASAIFPVAIAVFGLSQSMVFAVIAFGAVWPTLLATISGFDALHPRLAELRKLLGMSTMDYVRKVALPSALPEILAGMRLSLMVALILSVTGEILSSSEGLGHWIMLQARSYRSDTLFAGVLLFGAIGYLSAKTLTLFENHLVGWKRRS